MTPRQVMTLKHGDRVQWACEYRGVLEHETGTVTPNGLYAFIEWDDGSCCRIPLELVEYWENMALA